MDCAVNREGDRLDGSGDLPRRDALFLDRRRDGGGDIFHSTDDSSDLFNHRDRVAGRALYRGNLTTDVSCRFSGLS